MRAVAARAVVKVVKVVVQKALVKLGVPGRDDLNDLADRVETLTVELRQQRGGKAKAAPRKASAKKEPAARKTAKKAAKKRAG